MKTKMYKVLIVLGVIGILFGAVQLNEYSHGRLDFCFKDQITCATDKMEGIRANRDAVTKDRNDFVTQYNKETVEFNATEDAKLEAIKDTLPAGFVSDLIKKQDYKNVPKSIIEKLAPQAQASEVVEEKVQEPIVWPSMQEPVQQQVTLSTEESYSPLRYKAVLTALKSPYADVPIAQYCQQAGLALRECDIMVGIGQQESQSGKDYHCIQQTDAHAIELGQTYYFNPMGLKYPGEKGRDMDFQGCFIRKFESWDDFWKFMPKSFLNTDMAYYIGYWDTVSELSGIWKNGKIVNPDTDWTNTVTGMLTKIKKSQ